MEKFIIRKREVKIQLECTEVTPNTVARFRRPDESVAK
jgi:hypothetical protein